MPLTLEDLKKRRDEIIAIAKRRGAKNIRVFGSVARGDSGEDSDIDIVVEFEPHASLFDHAGLIADLQDALNCKVDVVSERGMKERMRKHVEREAVTL